MGRTHWKGDCLVTFDIETTGLSPVDHNFICSALYDGEKTMIDTSLVGLHSSIKSLRMDDSSYIIVTYNGGDFYNKGFDFPFLRYKYADEGTTYPFGFMKHLDLYPLVKKHLSVFTYEEKPPSLSSLYKDDLVKLAEINDLEYTTKGETYEAIEDLESPDWGDYVKESKVDMYDLQSLYKVLFDKEGEEEYQDGEEVPELAKEGKLSSIVEHNVNDVKRLHKIIGEMIRVIPSESIEKSIHRL